MSRPGIDFPSLPSSPSLDPVTRLRALLWLHRSGNLDVAPILGLIDEADMDRVRHTLAREVQV